MTLLTSQFCWNRKSRSGDRTELAVVSSGFSGTNYTSVCLRGCWREFSLRSPVCCLPGKMVETALVQPLFPLNSIGVVSGVCSRQQTQLNETALIASNNTSLFGLSLQICVSACADNADNTVRSSRINHAVHVTAKDAALPCSTAVCRRASQPDREGLRRASSVRRLRWTQWLDHKARSSFSFIQPSYTLICTQFFYIYFLNVRLNWCSKEINFIQKKSLYLLIALWAWIKWFDWFFFYVSYIMHYAKSYKKILIMF